MKNTMLAAIFEGEGKLRIRQVPVPELIQDDDVLIKVKMASICGTDVQILKVPAAHPATTGVILGHEYVGTVVRTGRKVVGIEIGDNVVVEPNLSCGHCEYCKTGNPNLCMNMTTFGIFENGGFAEFSLVPVRTVHKLKPKFSLETAVFAEPLSCVVNSINKLNPRQSDCVVVLGAGPIGLLFIKVLKAMGVRKIIVSQRSALRQQVAAECGATIVVDPTKQNIVEIVKAETGSGADIVIECVGSLLQDAISSCRKGGKVLLFGLNSHATAEIKPFEVTHKEIEIIGSFISKFTFPPAITMLENKIIDVTNLITHRFALDEFEKGLKVALEGKAIKVLITPPRG